MRTPTSAGLDSSWMRRTVCAGATSWPTIRTRSGRSPSATGCATSSSRALRTLVELEVEAGRLDAAADRARALTEVDAFDVDVWRRYLELCLRRGRRSEAARQYALLKNKMRRQFGEEPEFTLTDLSAAVAGDQPQAGSLLSADPTAVAAAR